VRYRKPMTDVQYIPQPCKKKKKSVNHTAKKSINYTIVGNVLVITIGVYLISREVAGQGSIPRDLFHCKQLLKFADKI
jgi:hypothetical protein